MARRNIRAVTKNQDDKSLFDYHLDCGHVVRGQDYRRWRNRILREPKSCHCDECPVQLIAK